MNGDNHWVLDLPSFFIGWGIAWYFGIILARIRKERGAMQQINRRMTVQTQQTPRQVFKLADAAFWRYVGYWILFIVSAVLFLTGMTYVLLIF